MLPPNIANPSLTTGVPSSPLGALGAAPQALLYVGSGVAAGQEDVPEQGDVGGGQAQRVDLGEAFLVGERGHVAAQLVEGRVDAEHPPPLAEVGGAALPGPPGWALVRLSTAWPWPGGLCQALQEEVLQMCVGICRLPEERFRSGVSLLEVVAKFLHAPACQAQGIFTTSGYQGNGVLISLAIVGREFWLCPWGILWKNFLWLQIQVGLGI